MRVLVERLTDRSSQACICEYWERAVHELVREPAEDGRDDGREDGRELARELQALAAA